MSSKASIEINVHGKHYSPGTENNRNYRMTWFGIKVSAQVPCSQAHGAVGRLYETLFHSILYMTAYLDASVSAKGRPSIVVETVGTLNLVYRESDSLKIGGRRFFMLSYDYILYNQL